MTRFANALQIWGLVVLAPASGAAQPPAGRVPLDRDAVERWVDGQVGPALKSSGIPAALVVVVQRSGIVLNKAYGLSDVANHTPADASTTLFEYASIGKTMTAVIASQLIDEGVLDLDQAVNRYLKTAQVSGPKVTLRMLLAHRAGFDDDITGLFAPFDGDIRMSRAELDRRLRPRVPPGSAVAYDNQGFGVVGLILRDVTGKPIPALYRERLFEPAGMTNAVHGRPADGMARLARCYTVQGPGAVRECELWLYREGLMGAGGVAATGADMARYMRMLLNGGTLDGRTVMTPRAFADLTNFDHYRFHPGLPGGGHAFIQFEELRGLEYAHSGSIPGFSSMMKIYPDADVAILVTFLGGQPPAFEMTLSNVVTSLQRVSMRDEAKPGLNVMRELTDKFAEQFIPAGRPRSSEGPAPLAGASADRVDDYLGTYVIASNHSRSLIARVAGWAGLVTLEPAPGGNLRLGGYAELGEYHRVGPLLYENPKGDRIALAEGPTGKYLAIGLSGGVFNKTNAVESPAWSVFMFIFAFPVLLTALIQLRAGVPDPVRRLARGALVGFALVLIGVLAEWEWGVRLSVVEGAWLTPLIWRLALHAGVIVLLWSGFRFFRTGGDARRWITSAHGFVIAAAGWAVALATVMWRAVGAFPPQFWW